VAADVLSHHSWWLLHPRDLPIDLQTHALSVVVSDTLMYSHVIGRAGVEGMEVDEGEVGSLQLSKPAQVTQPFFVNLTCRSLHVP